MANVPRVIRVPNLPIGRLVDENGMATDDFLTFLQALTTSLQNNYGPEGLVMPTQSATDRTAIQNHTNAQGQFTCQAGTMLYVQHPTDYTQDTVEIAVRNSNTFPDAAPLFKVVTLT